MPNNINKHQPITIRFAHNLSYENILNGWYINIDTKSNSDFENFVY